MPPVTPCQCYRAFLVPPCHSNESMCMGSDINDDPYPISLQDLCGGSHQSKIGIVCHATSSPEANKDETTAQEPSSTPVAPPRHPKTDTEVLQLHPILCSTVMDNIEQPVESSESLEFQAFRTVNRLFNTIHICAAWDGVEL